MVELKGVDVFDPTTGEVRSGDSSQIALWMVESNDNEESFFVRHCCFSGGNDGAGGGAVNDSDLRCAGHGDLSSCMVGVKGEAERGGQRRQARRTVGLGAGVASGG
jgi:hypothetical protein